MVSLFTCVRVENRAGTSGHIVGHTIMTCQAYNEEEEILQKCIKNPGILFLRIPRSRNHLV